MKKDDVILLVLPNGQYRYGYITEAREKGYVLTVSLYEEGESKILFDDAIIVPELAQLTGGQPVDSIPLLTDIEKKLIPLLAAGASTGEIAEKQGISPVTVRSHLRTLRIKLHLENRSQLVAMAQGIEALMEEADE